MPRINSVFSGAMVCAIVATATMPNGFGTGYASDSGPGRKAWRKVNQPPSATPIHTTAAQRGVTGRPLAISRGRSPKQIATMAWAPNTLIHATNVAAGLGPEFAYATGGYASPTATTAISNPPVHSSHP